MRMHSSTHPHSKSQVLTIRKISLMQVATSNLALVLSDQGKYEEAEEMHRELLVIMQKVLWKGAFLNSA